MLQGSSSSSDKSGWGSTALLRWALIRGEGKSSSGGSVGACVNAAEIRSERQALAELLCM